MRRIVGPSLVGLVLAAAAGQAVAEPVPPAPTPDQVQAAVAALPATLPVRPPPLSFRPLLLDVPPPPATPRPGEPVTVEGWAPSTGGQGLPYGGGWSPTGRREDVRVGPYRQPE